MHLVSTGERWCSVAHIPVNRNIRAGFTIGMCVLSVPRSQEYLGYSRTLAFS